MSSISTEELKQRLQDGGFTLIDVREEWEFEEFNIGGKLMPLNTIEARIAELKPLKASEIIICCRSGNRSATAQRILERLGFQNVKALEGGLNTW